MCNFVNALFHIRRFSGYVFRPYPRPSGSSSDEEEELEGEGEE